MTTPILRTHILETPEPYTPHQFWHWESINRPGNRYFMKHFHPEDIEDRFFTAHQSANREYGDIAEKRFSRWVCVYEEYDQDTWDMIT